MVKCLAAETKDDMLSSQSRSISQILSLGRTDKSTATCAVPQKTNVDQHSLISAAKACASRHFVGVYLRQKKKGLLWSILDRQKII